MTQTIQAVFENGVFRPIEKVDLPDPCQVEVEVRQVQGNGAKPTLDEIYAILSERYDYGDCDVAERHNEHQP